MKAALVEVARETERPKDRKTEKTEIITPLLRWEFNGPVDWQRLVLAEEQLRVGHPRRYLEAIAREAHQLRRPAPGSGSSLKPIADPLPIGQCDRPPSPAAHRPAEWGSRCQVGGGANLSATSRALTATVTSGGTHP